MFGYLMRWKAQRQFPPHFVHFGNDGRRRCLFSWAVFPCLFLKPLLVIARIGAITLFIAATIAITATDIKRVLPIRRLVSSVT